MIALPYNVSSKMLVGYGKPMATLHSAGMDRTVELNKMDWVYAGNDLYIVNVKLLWFYIRAFILIFLCHSKCDKGLYEIGIYYVCVLEGALFLQIYRRDSKKFLRLICKTYSNVYIIQFL